METTTGKPCQVCGGIGYAKCIVTCSKCLKAREHMYCMQPNLNYIPQSWLCEACRCHGPRRFTARKKVLVRKVLTKVDVENSVGSSSGKLAAPPSTIMGNSSSHHCSTSQKGSISRNHCTMHNHKSAAVILEKQYLKKYARHSKILPIGNAWMSTAKHQASDLSQPLHGLRSSLESPCKILKSEDINSVRVTSIGDERHISDEAHRSPQNYTGPLAYDVRGKSNIKNILSKLDQLPAVDQVDSILCTNVCQEKPVDAVLQYNETGTSEAKTSFKVNQIAPDLLNAQQGIEHENASGKLDMHADEVSTGNIEPSLLKNVYKVANTDADAWFNVNEVSKSQTSYREENTLNSPTGHSSWKGSFEILNFPLERFDGLQAYPPQRVSRNAYLASNQMPRILQFTLQPHNDVWPATFNTRSPSGLDIGLYLLPDQFCRIKEKYNGLVELMEQDDLSLRSCFNGVELLIFTSRRLPSESQRLNKQVYLWAVFLSSKGRHSSVGLRDVIDNASPNHKPGENLATVPHEFLDQIVDTVDDTVGDKEVDRVDQCLRSNFRDACSSSLNITSQGVVFGAVLSQPVHKGTIATHLQEVKREPYDDIGVSPGFSKRQPDQKFTVGSHLHQVKTNHCNEFDPPPGFSRSVKSNASVVGPTIAMSPAVNKLDASSGFSELLNLKLCASSSKHSPPVLNANVVWKVRKMPRMRTRFLPNLLLPSSDKSKYPCSLSDENGGGGIDMAIRTPHDQILPSDKSKNSYSRSDENGGGINMVMRSPHDQLLQSPDKSKKSCSQSDENGGGGTNMAIRPLHDQMKEMFMTQFTQEQMDKMSSFAEKVGWSISKQEESVVQQFCQEIGVRRPALKVWMNYKKQDMNVHSSSASKRKSVPDEQDGGGEINLTTRSPNHQVKKRLRTRFTREQQDNMLSFAEKVGWSISSQDEAEVQKFCQGIGISSRVLKVWMHNKKHNLKIKPSGSCTRKSLSPDRSNAFPLKSDEQDVGRGLDVAVKPSYFQVKKRFKTTLTQEQKNKVLSFAEKVGRCIRGQEAAVLQQLCQEIGVERRVLAVWMDSNKHKFSKKINFSTACTTKSLSPDILSPLCSGSSRDLNVGNRTPHHQVRKSFDQFLRNSSMDAYSRSLNMASQSLGVSTTTVPSQEVKREHCDYSDAPPGFATQVSSSASIERTIARSEVKMSPVNQVDDPPEFSGLIHLKRLDSTSEIAHKMKKQKTNDSMSKCTALPLNYRIAEGSENFAQEDNDQIVDMKIDMVGGIEVERVDKLSGRNLMATCTSNLDMPPKCVSSGNVLSQPVDRGVTKMYSQEVNVENCDDLDSPPGFSRVLSSHPVLACNVVRNMHHVETDYCNDYAPPGFSRTVMSSAADVRPIATLHVTMPPVVDNEDATPGFSKLIKRKQWDSLSKWSSPTPNTNLVGMESKSSPTQLLFSPERSKPVEDKSCFCRICNLSCSGMGSFMQHLAGKKHAFGIQDFSRAMRCKEDYERHGKYYLSSLYKSSDAAYRSSELCDRNMRYEANFGSNGRYCLSPSTR